MLIFLDIDGVMVSAKSWQSPQLLNDGFTMFSPKATSVLQKLVSEDTTIMLTTSHKSKYTIEEWKNIFERRGININKLGLLDENTNRLNRKDEILNWVNLNHLSEDFIIIDDDKSLNALPAFLKNNLVLTSSLVGLTDEHLNEIEKIVNRKPQLA